MPWDSKIYWKTMILRSLYWNYTRTFLKCQIKNRITSITTIYSFPDKATKWRFAPRLNEKTWRKGVCNGGGRILSTCALQQRWLRGPVYFQDTRKHRILQWSFTEIIIKINTYGLGSSSADNNPFSLAKGVERKTFQHSVNHASNSLNVSKLTVLPDGQVS